LSHFSDVFVDGAMVGGGLLELIFDVFELLWVIAFSAFLCEAQHPISVGEFLCEAQHLISVGEIHIM